MVVSFALGQSGLNFGWTWFRSREQDLINERLPPPLIDHAAKTFYVDNEVRAAPPTPDSPRHIIVAGSLTESPSSGMQALTLTDTADPAYAAFSGTGYEAGLGIQAPSPRRATMILGPTIGTTRTSSPSMRKRTLEDTDALLKKISGKVGGRSLRRM